MEYLKYVADDRHREMLGHFSNPTGLHEDFVVESTQNDKKKLDINTDDIPVLSLTEEDIEVENNLAEVSEQPVVYISGYLTSKIIKNHQCQDCHISLIEVDPEKLLDPTYNYISLREWWKIETSLTNPSKNFCMLVQNATALMENEICPVLYRRNICKLAVTVFMTQCNNTWFKCPLHKDNLIFNRIYILLGQLLIRRQCQRLNQGMALQEESLADTVKKAQQQGKAK